MSNIHIKKLLEKEGLLIGFSCSLVVYTLLIGTGLTLFTLIFGVISFIFIPGFYLACILRKKIVVDAFGYSFILGLTLQILILCFYSLLSNILRLDFGVLLIITTVLLVVALRMLAFKLEVHLDLNELKGGLKASFRNPITYIFIFAFVFRLYYLSFNTGSFMPDAALYLDSSRTLVTKGVFSSSVLFDESLGTIAKTGLIDHSFITYLFGISFEISSISLNSALVSIALVGSLLIYPIYSLATSLFGKNVGLLAGIILSIHPLFIYYSAIVFGPEISGLLFLITSLYFAIEGCKTRSATLLILSGLLLGISEEFWWYPFYVIVILIPFIFILYYDRSKFKTTTRGFLLNILIALSSLSAYCIALKLGSLYYLYIPVVFFECLLFIISYKMGRNFIHLMAGFVLGIIVPTIVGIVKSYLLSSATTLIVQKANSVGLIPSMFNAFTFFFKSSSLTSGMFDLTKYLTDYATIFVLILFFLAFMSTSKIKIKIVLGGIILLNCILLSLRPPPIYPEYFSSNGRYFLLPISLMIIVGSSFVVGLIKSSIPYSSLVIKLKRDYKRISLATISSFLVIAILLGVFFIPQYESNSQLISNENPMEKYGWSNDMLNWINANTSANDVFLTSRARELAWMTDRQTVVVTNGNTDKLDSLSTKFNATYLVTDDYMYWTSPSLVYFSLSATQVNQISMPSGTILSILDNSNLNSNCYKLVYSDNTIQNLKIWKILTPDKILLNPNYQNISSAVWSVGNGEKKATNEKAFTVTIGANNTYAYSYAKDSLNVSLPQDAEKFFAWNVTDIPNGKILRIEFWSNGQHVSDINPPSKLGVWITALQMTKIDDVRLVFSGNASDYVSIGWLAIGSYVASEIPA